MLKFLLSGVSLKSDGGTTSCPSVIGIACLTWYHKDCLGMSTQIYQGLHNVSWYCDICGLPNFSSCFFDNTSFVNTNMFEPLSRQDQSKTNWNVSLLFTLVMVDVSNICEERFGRPQMSQFQDMFLKP
jgi:hypothetical protein